MPIKKILITAIILFYSQSALALLGRPTSFDDRTACEDSKGVWRQFGNGCADNCEAKLDKFAICTQALVFSCECGYKRCWNGDSCVTMDSYSKIYEEQKSEEQKIIDEEKKKRKKLAKVYREQLLLKLKNQINPNSNQQNNSQIEAAKPRESNVIINDPNAQNLADDIASIQPPAQESEPEIPPLYLKKQAKIQQEIDNLKNPSSNSAAASSEVPPGLPEIKLPN